MVTRIPSLVDPTEDPPIIPITNDAGELILNQDPTVIADASLATLFLHLCNLCQSDPESVLCDTYGSHVFSAAVCVLAGVPTAAYALRSKASASYRTTFSGAKVRVGASVCQCVAGFRTQLM